MKIFKWLSKLAKVDDNAADFDKGRNHGEKSKNDVRRSTRLSLQIPVVITSLDPSRNFREECKTVSCSTLMVAALSSTSALKMKLRWP